MEIKEQKGSHWSGENKTGRLKEHGKPLLGSFFELVTDIVVFLLLLLLLFLLLLLLLLLLSSFLPIKKRWVESLLN